MLSKCNTAVIFHFQIENLTMSNDRKTHILIEDLSHYIQQHRNRYVHYISAINENLRKLKIV